MSPIDKDLKINPSKELIPKETVIEFDNNFTKLSKLLQRVLNSKSQKQLKAIEDKKQMQFEKDRAASEGMV